MAAGISAGLAARWFQPVDAAMKEFGITAPTDKAMFIAQVGHESGGFSAVVENLNYTPSALVATFGKRITQQQADALGRTTEHAARQMPSPIWFIATAWVTKRPATAGNIAAEG